MALPNHLNPIAPELRSAFQELLAMDGLARLSEEALIRVLKTIPQARLQRALAEVGQLPER